MADNGERDDQRKDEDDTGAAAARGRRKKISLARALFIMVGMAIKDRKKQVPSEHDESGWFW